MKAANEYTWLLFTLAFVLITLQLTQTSQPLWIRDYQFYISNENMPTEDKTEKRLICMYVYKIFKCIYIIYIYILMLKTILNWRTRTDITCRCPTVQVCVYLLQFLIPSSIPFQKIAQQSHNVVHEELRSWNWSVDVLLYKCLNYVAVAILIRMRVADVILIRMRSNYDAAVILTRVRGTSSRSWTKMAIMVNT